MNVDELVVLTYPRHMFITCLTIREAIKWQKWDKPVTVLYDDMFHPQYVTYCDDLQEQIKKYIPGIELNLIPYSRLGILQHHVILKEPMKYGWIRQQLVKLYLDQLLDTNKWFILDSDCMLLQYIPDNVNVYSWWYNYADLANGFQNYWNYMYKKEVYIEHPSNPVPFRYLNKNLLQKMKTHISKKHNKSFIDIHYDLLSHNGLMDNANMNMSEWDLIEYYHIKYIQKENDIKFIPVRLVNFCDMQYKIEKDNLCIGTFYGNDADLGMNWFHKNGITVSDKTYQTIIKHWINDNSDEYTLNIKNWNTDCLQ